MGANYKQNSQILGHILAFFTVFVWGITLVSTKILLRSFQPVEILFFRFLIAFFMLYIVSPKNLYKITNKQKFVIALAGLCGITLYYLFENISLMYTLASNFSIISSFAPFFIAILTFCFMKNDEKINKKFLIGCIIATIGIILIIYNSNKINLSPKGDILAIISIIFFALYSILVKKLSKINLPMILITRNIFFSGIIFMIPFLFLFNFKFGFSRFINPINLFNILFLGIIASGFCFFSWNKAIQILGAVNTSIYIDLIPVITIIFSSFILKEPITKLLILGIFLTFLGLVISQSKLENKNKTNNIFR